MASAQAEASRGLSDAFVSVRGLERCFWLLHAQLALQAADRGATAEAHTLLSEAKVKLLGFAATAEVAAAAAAGQWVGLLPSSAASAAEDGGRSARPSARDAVVLELESELSALSLRLGRLGEGLRLAASAHAGLSELCGEAHPSALAARLRFAAALAASGSQAGAAHASAHAKACVELCRGGDGSTKSMQLVQAELAVALIDANQAGDDKAGEKQKANTKEELSRIVKDLRRRVGRNRRPRPVVLPPHATAERLTLGLAFAAGR